MFGSAALLCVREAAIELSQRNYSGAVIYTGFAVCDIGSIWDVPRSVGKDISASFRRLRALQS
jgi:hypothetical protein